MDEEITIINTKTRNEKIKNFFIKNKKLLILVSIFLILILISFFSYQIYKDGHRDWLANKYNRAIIEYENGNKSKIISTMKEIIEYKDTTYSPLGLYFLMDNNLVDNKDEINNLFNILINESSLELEIKNLLIYKKALFNSESSNESDLLNILNPILNSDSVWKSHSLYLLGEYFFSKSEKQKAKEFFEKILEVNNSNPNIKSEALKRIERDFNE